MAPLPTERHIPYKSLIWKDIARRRPMGIQRSGHRIATPCWRSPLLPPLEPTDNPWRHPLCPRFGALPRAPSLPGAPKTVGSPFGTTCRLSDCSEPCPEPEPFWEPGTPEGRRMAGDLFVRWAVIGCRRKPPRSTVSTEMGTGGLASGGRQCT